MSPILVTNILIIFGAWLFGFLLGRTLRQDAYHRRISMLRSELRDWKKRAEQWRPEDLKFPEPEDIKKEDSQ